MEDTKPKPFVFVLMPFSDEFADIYEVGIKPACKDAGAYCERVDEQIFVENILERVYNQIAKADVIIAEMTGRNANVFYETGYAHALNKRVILLTQNADDIPFDLKHYPHVVYGDKIALLKSELEKRVRWCVENPQKSLASVDIDLEVTVNGTLLGNNPVVEVGYRDDIVYGMNLGISGHRAHLKIGIHNKTSQVLDAGSYSMALVLPNAVQLSNFDYLQPNDKQLMWNLLPSHSLFPDAWHSMTVGLLVNAQGLGASSPGSLLRLFTEIGPKDFAFRLKPVRVE